MKKLFLLAYITLMGTACVFGQNGLDNPTVYTTIYPVTYLTEYLYGEHSEIKSIYPADADVFNYDFTDKQKEEFALGDLFIYAGVTEEINIAKDFVDYNNDILLIDSTHTFKLENTVEEIWLSPNNYLMLAKNIKNSLNEYVTNLNILDDINVKYDELAEILSFMDADLRIIGNKAKEENNNVLVVSSDTFKYLENYGFVIISLEDSKYETVDARENIISNFENDNYLALINEYGNGNEVVNEIAASDSVTKIDIDIHSNAEAGTDYLSVMQEFVANLQHTVNN